MRIDKQFTVTNLKVQVEQSFTINCSTTAHNFGPSMNKLEAGQSHCLITVPELLHRAECFWKKLEQMELMRSKDRLPQSV